ncbi:hypothetical protein F5Y08DRAFT_117481 [Xylaria arbuscula]|nr:hypothetical protein F5Y08DRAFT_117481 [Xylaria arbuscula]
MIEWVYVFDLDRELFSVQNCCFFHMSKISSQTFEDLMEQSQEYWFGNLSDSEVHESIATGDIRPTTLTHNPSPAFLQMTPTTINPRHESKLNHMPAYEACEFLYNTFISYHKDELLEALNSRAESDFLFRQFVFAMLCFASCSPEWVRLVSTSNMLHNKRYSRYQARTCAAILDSQSRKPKELVTHFLQNFHLEGKEAGSAPESTSYWFCGALGYLRRDIISRERFQDAIVSAVEKGKADGRTHFHAIIISLKHFILLKFNNGNVEHTKRLNIYGSRGLVKTKAVQFYNPRPEEDEPKEQGEIEGGEDTEPEENTSKGEECGQDDRETGSTTGSDGKEPISEKPEGYESATAAQDDPKEIDDWAEENNVATFSILAHFFHATQNETLRPSIVHNEGVFPNEIYHRILQFVDRETNVACLKVSRTFREYASETFIMDQGLKVIYCPGEEPVCIDDTLGDVGPFSPALYFNDSDQSGKDFFAVFGKPDGSASAEFGMKFRLDPESNYI